MRIYAYYPYIGPLPYPYAHTLQSTYLCALTCAYTHQHTPPGHTTPLPGYANRAANRATPIYTPPGNTPGHKKAPDTPR